MLTQSGAKQIVKIVRAELSGTELARPRLLKPKLEAFLRDLAELMQYEELKPSTKDKSRRSLENLKILTDQLMVALSDPVPELYGALLEMVATRRSESGHIGKQSIEELVANLDILQRAATTALLDAYRQTDSDRSVPITRFLSYRIAVLMDSHFGEGAATDVRGRMFDQVLRVVLIESGINPPTDLAKQVMPQALKILRLDQSSLKPTKAFDLKTVTSKTDSP
jgi:hypothetical protein